MNRCLLFCIINLLLIPALKLTSQDNQRKHAEINILNADFMEAPLNGMSSDLIRIIGNVRLSHDDVYMYCDSAHRYSNSNIVHAFSNVHINRGDTLHLYGDYLIYYGNTKYAEVRGNVRLMDNETTLITEYLDFDLSDDFGYYPKSGIVINGDNRLESIQGYYYTNEKLFFFKDSVIITNPDYTISSDTLKYNTVTEVAFFLGPTTIIGNETYIYCENGWYNTKTDISQFRENALIRNNNQLLKADSLYYDNKNGTGEAFINVEVTDTIENIVIKGDYAWFSRDPEHVLVTDNALFIQISKNDTLYLHADTLRSWLQINEQDFELEESISAKPDREVEESFEIVANISSREIDTVRIMVAYYGAKFFSHELQGKCDSLYYNMRDSVIFMFGEPVIWSGESQLSSEFMRIHIKEEELDHIVMNNSAFIISEETPGLYNQIKGKDILGYFQQGGLYRVNVAGNAETLYYPAENEEIIGINKAASSSLVIFLKDSKPERIRFLNQPAATLYPLEEISEKDRLLKDFQWLEHVRPKNKEDILIEKLNTRLH